MSSWPQIIAVLHVNTSKFIFCYINDDFYLQVTRAPSRVEHNKNEQQFGLFRGQAVLSFQFYASFQITAFDLRWPSLAKFSAFRVLSWQFCTASPAINFAKIWLFPGKDQIVNWCRNETEKKKTHCAPLYKVGKTCFASLNSSLIAPSRVRVQSDWSYRACFPTNVPTNPESNYPKRFAKIFEFPDNWEHPAFAEKKMNL